MVIRVFTATQQAPYFLLSGTYKRANISMAKLCGRLMPTWQSLSLWCTVFASHCVSVFPAGAEDTMTLANTVLLRLAGAPPWPV